MRFLMNLLLVVLLVVVVAAWVMLPWPGAVVLAVLLAAWLLFTRRGRQAGSVANVGISISAARLKCALLGIKVLKQALAMKYEPSPEEEAFPDGRPS